MSYDDDSLLDEEQGFKASDESDDDLDESMEPLEGASSLDFEEEDPDSSYH